MKPCSRLRCMLAVALLLCAGTSHANVVIYGTRVVYPAQDRDITVRLQNQGNQPSLIQAWVDDGNPKSQPDTAKAPFLITPPLFRIDGHKAQDLRIIFTGAKLPADRESLFWLNVLEIPPKPNKRDLNGNQNYLQLAIRSRLKLFYRPAGLAMDPQKAPGKLAWHARHDGHGWMLEVDNPTPYHVTLATVRLQAEGKTYAATTGMVDPQGKLLLKLKGLRKAPAQGTEVSYQIINDFGALANFKGTVSP